MSSARLREAMDTVRSFVRQEAIRGGILIVIRDGKLVFHDTAGWNDMERGLPMRPDQVVTMRSMTKPLVGAAALILLQEGKLSLDDRVAKYLPSFDNPKSRDITISQLLSHTSGLRGEIYNDQVGFGTPFRNLREAADSVGKLGPETPPGTMYWYSDPGTSTLGAVIAVAAGMPCEDFIQRRILDPLGMRDSFLMPPSPSDPRRARLSATYRKVDGKWVRYWDPTMAPAVPFFRASGGLYASGLDYARFLTMMLNHGRFGTERLLDSGSVAVALQPHQAAVLTPEERKERDSFYGFTWTVFTDRYRPVRAPFSPGTFQHSGSDGTIGWVDPSKQLIIVYLTQSRGARTSQRIVGMVYDAITDAAVPTGNRQQPALLDVLFLNGRVLDGAGNPWVRQDVGTRGDRIAWLGLASHERPVARDTVDIRGLYLAPGFIDMHSHADFSVDYGRAARPLLAQGITTVVLGIDGAGTNRVREEFGRYATSGIAVNALQYVGHGAARSAVMGPVARAPSAEELRAMRDYVRQGMEEGAIGLSTGLFYSPGTYATTDEVVALNRVAAEYGGIYDTHDRDLGGSYPGIGFLESMKEAIAIGEQAGTPVIFSHIGPQGWANYGKAGEAARLVESARARGVNVMAAQHPYTSTASNLRSYAIPDWAAEGGQARMLARFKDPAMAARLDRETMEMMHIRGGAEKIVFSDARSTLNGRTLAQVAADLDVPVPAAVRRLLEGGNASVMNRDLYDLANIRFLATRDWMMTCTDGGTPNPDVAITHPRSYGAFTRKLRWLALDDSVITLPFAIRGMTSLAATFVGLSDRGLVKPGFAADLVVFDVSKVRDRATYEAPHQLSEGMVHVLVNGRFAVREGRPTGVLAGMPLTRGGKAFRGPS
ncbi:MAG: serine hydrolase [Gemmatimonadales bacterium]